MNNYHYGDYAPLRHVHDRSMWSLALSTTCRNCTLETPIFTVPLKHWNSLNSPKLSPITSISWTRSHRKVVVVAHLLRACELKLKIVSLTPWDPLHCRLRYDSIFEMKQQLSTLSPAGRRTVNVVGSWTICLHDVFNITWQLTQTLKDKFWDRFVHQSSWKGLLKCQPITLFHPILRTSYQLGDELGKYCFRKTCDGNYIINSQRRSS